MADTNETNVVVNISAKIDSLQGQMAAASAAVTESTSAMKASFASLTAMVETVMAPLLAVTAILTGGKMFKDAVAGTQEWTRETLVLARTLGIATEEASILNVALDDIYVSTETYTHAVQMMTRNIATGGKGFDALGISTKDSNGHLKASGQLMTEVLDKLNSLKQGTDRNVAGLTIFGRSWGEAQKLLKLNGEVMDEARKKAESLGLVVGTKDVASYKAYKAALNDVEDAFKGMTLAVGRELIPMLTGLANWFKEIGPAAIATFKFSWQLLVTIIDTALAPLRVLADVLVAVAHALSGDFAAAGEALKEIPGDLDIIGRMIDRLNDKPLKITKQEKDSSGDEFDPDKSKDESEKQLAVWKTQLEEKKALEANWFSWDVAQEIEFWNRKFAETTRGTKAYSAILAELNKLNKTSRKEQIDLDVDYAKYEMTRAGDDLAVKLKWAQAIVDGQAAIYGKGSREYVAALREVATVENTIREKQKKDAFEMFAPATAAWDSAFSKMLAGTQSFAGSVREVVLGIGQTFDKMILNFINNWIGSQAKAFAIWASMKVKELFLHNSIEQQKAASTAAAATAEVGSNAAVAGSAAAATAAQTPGIGWLIAIPAALAVVAGVMAMKGSISSAAGGWGNIPNDQMAMVHKNEMILPAPLAESVRQMAAGGGVAGGGDIHIHAMDAGSFLDFAQANKGAFRTVITDLARNNSLNVGRI